VSAVWFWVVPVLFCTPWAVAIVWAWRLLPRDGWIPPSAGERALERLASR
jgi:hypothetical protein